MPASENIRERRLNHGGPEGLWLRLQPGVGWGRGGGGSLTGVEMMPSEIVCP